MIPQVLKGEKSTLDVPTMIVGKLMSQKLMTARVKNTILKELAQAMTELKPATGLVAGEMKKLSARESYRRMYNAVKDDNVGQDTLLELTQFMMNRLRMSPTIAATQIYKQVTEDK